MKRTIYFLLCGLLLYLTRATCHGHEEPTSFANLEIGSDSIDLTISASNLDLAHDLKDIEPKMLLDANVIKNTQDELSNILLSRIKLLSDGRILTGKLVSVSPIPEKRDLSFKFRYPMTAHPKEFQMECHLFPYDPRHRTYLNIYQGKSLFQQLTFEGKVSSFVFRPNEPQSILLVIREFTYEGIHHIFIGPDHILFVIGLLLLGGSISQLLRILTAFTLAHSITLGLATFRLLSPPASIIEPIIALSIVVVGIHAFYGQKQRDPRMLFAFGFGLIHGFGFASVLQEMELPAHALGWSLLAFNVGVEIGQACILVAVAPALAILAKNSPVLARRLTHGLALGVTTAGAFWFFQRVF